MTVFTHLSYRLGGCATAAADGAIVDADLAGEVTCPICLRATARDIDDLSAYNEGQWSR